MRDLNYSAYCRECRNRYMRLKRKRFSEMNPEQKRKAKCRSYTSTLIERGVLVPAPCEVCGEAEVSPHHLNYDDPRAVAWLCEKHHREEHKRMAGTA